MGGLGSRDMRPAWEQEKYVRGGGGLVGTREDEGDWEFQGVD
jgi:hypothetical protein